MNRIMAIVEREMRKFFRSPALMMASMIFPLVQLIVLGNAFGGKIKDAKLGLVDQDGGTQALKIRQAFDSVRANMRTFLPVYYTNDKQAMEDVRNGKIQGAVIIPPQYSRRVYEQDQPRIALVVDNTDNFMSSTLEGELADITNALNQPNVEPRVLQQTVLQIVELYPYIEYMKYLLPGSIALAMFVSVMIGGGMLYIDDKARGVHEGYLVTPITKTELVFGLNTAGAIKAVLTGVVITIIGSLLSGVSTLLNPFTMLGLLIMILLTSIAFNTMMFLLMVRVEDPLVPRAIFGAAVFPQRFDLSHSGVSVLAARHREDRSVHLRDPRIQGVTAERGGILSDCAGHDLSLTVRGHYFEHRHAAVQEDAVAMLASRVCVRLPCQQILAMRLPCSDNREMLAKVVDELCGI